MQREPVSTFSSALCHRISPCERRPPWGIDVLTRERAFTIRGGKAAIETARTTILILF